MLNLILIVIIIVGIMYLFKAKEKFGWACYYSSQKDYYKDKWLLGDNPVAESLARDTIKPIINN